VTRLLMCLLDISAEMVRYHLRLHSYGGYGVG
jgi:hypothetical protein